MPRILVGTRDGLYDLDVASGKSGMSHAGRDVTDVALEGGELWAILDGSEIWHAAGVDWSLRVADLQGLSGNCIADTRAGIVVGTSEAHLFRVAGDGLEAISSFDQLDEREEWFTPWGGPPDTRSITEDDEAVYVNVHVGGILRSDDQGATWRPTIDIHEDVHCVLAQPGNLLAACAGGLATSPDHGRTWTIRSDGLHAAYCRGLAVCGDRVLLTASTGPGGRRSAIYRAALAGGSFERCIAGLPEWFDDNIDSLCLDAVADGSVAAFGTADGQVFASIDCGETWGAIASDLPQVRCVLALP
jgi:hypothetical protein